MSKKTKVKVSDLAGIALDWAVDAALTRDPMRVEYKKDGSGKWMLFCKNGTPAPGGPRKFSGDWNAAGLILDVSRIAITPCMTSDEWTASMIVGRFPTPPMRGKTALIAAMRCYVAAELGTAIEVPAELLEGVQ